MLEAREKLVSVSPKDIEQPVDLGNRCTLLNHFGMQPYWHTEEEVSEFLKDAFTDKNTLPLCLKSRCGEFYQRFLRDETPFFERDPIFLVEFQGKFWVEEGKHRVCLAKRMGIQRIQAFVQDLDKNYYALLPGIGQPDIFRSEYFFVVENTLKEIGGDVLFLWAPEVSPLNSFADPFMRLDVMKDTGGKWVQVLPGVEYSVAVRREERRRWFREAVRSVFVSTEAKVKANHKKTRIWLFQAPAEETLGIQFKSPAYLTLYRYGRWRKYHEDRLGRNFERIF
ncbi:hypothetical protein SDD30_14120 [Moorella naiadis]|uniref:hypothetical protein n=1 Tax=Moorella naiadis (nom. illeg.) TaxID=3093670 RepID=UPI003D9C8807